MKTKIISISVMTILFVCQIYAQNDAVFLLTNQENQKKISGIMAAEAKKFKVEIDKQKIHVSSANGVMIVNNKIINAQKLDEKSLVNGYNTTFVYFNASGKSNIKNGFYVFRVRRLPIERQLQFELVDSRGSSFPVRSIFDAICPIKNEPQSIVRITEELWFEKYQATLLPKYGCFADPNNPPSFETCGFTYMPK